MRRLPPPPGLAPPSAHDAEHDRDTQGPVTQQRAAGLDDNVNQQQTEKACEKHDLIAKIEGLELAEPVEGNAFDFPCAPN